MADHTIPELSDQQIELAQQFNALAKSFMDLLIRQVTRGDVIKDVGLDQTNSYLATQAMIQLERVREESHGRYILYLNAVKSAALSFSRDAIETGATKKLKSALCGCEESINRALFTAAVTQTQDMPIEIFRYDGDQFDVPHLVPKN